MSLELDPKTTALVLIDLQNGIVGRQLAPHSAAEVMKNSVKIAEALRASGGKVIYVRVLVSEMLRLPVDAPNPTPDTPPPASASELSLDAGFTQSDVLVTKRQWGAFYGTDLEQHLRRAGIRTIIMGGVATNFGVESTARAAADQGFALVFAEDAMSSMSAEWHEFPLKAVFPRMGKIRSSTEIVAALEAAS
jgi:nicotinamidase-related amidase